MTYQPTEEELDLLVAYTLDALEPHEVREALTLLDRQPSLAQLVAELRATSALLPYGLPESVPVPSLRTRVLAYATGRAIPQAVPPALPSAARVRWPRWLAGLSGALALAVALLGAQIGNLNAELARAQQTISALQDGQTELTRVLSQAADVAELRGEVGNGRLIRAADGTMLLAVTLPPSQPDRAYQLWMIDDTGQPVSAAVFRIESGETRLVPVARPITGQLAAITEEPAGGSPGPTTRILISGELG